MASGRGVCWRKSSKKIRQLCLVVGLSVACATTGHRAIATWAPSYNELAAQQGQPPALPGSSTPTSQSARFDAVKQSARNNLKASLEEVARLRGINWAWSIAFIVAGITLTLIATSLGAVESQNEDVKKWTKFAIVGLGAGAVAAQSLNASFPVTKKEAEFADIYWNLMSLQGRIDQVATEGELKQLISEYAELLKRVGKVESSLDQPGGQ